VLWVFCYIFVAGVSILSKILPGCCGLAVGQDWLRHFPVHGGLPCWTQWSWWLGWCWPQWLSALYHAPRTHKMYAWLYVAAWKEQPRAWRSCSGPRPLLHAVGSRPGTFRSSGGREAVEEVEPRRTINLRGSFTFFRRDATTDEPATLNSTLVRRFRWVVLCYVEGPLYPSVEWTGDRESLRIRSEPLGSRVCQRGVNRVRGESYDPEWIVVRECLNRESDPMESRVCANGVSRPASESENSEWIDVRGSLWVWSELGSTRVRACRVNLWWWEFDNLEWIAILASLK